MKACAGSIWVIVLAYKDFCCGADAAKLWPDVDRSKNRAKTGFAPVPIACDDPAAAAGHQAAALLQSGAGRASCRRSWTAIRCSNGMSGRSLPRRTVRPSIRRPERCARGRATATLWSPRRACRAPTPRRSTAIFPMPMTLAASRTERRPKGTLYAGGRPRRQPCLRSEGAADIGDVAASMPSLRDQLAQQLRLEFADPGDRLIGAHLIALLDGAGRLTAEPAAIAAALATEARAGGGRAPAHDALRSCGPLRARPAGMPGRAARRGQSSRSRHGAAAGQSGSARPA